MPAPEPTARHPDDDLTAQVWRAMTGLVTDSRDGWKREVIAATGLPFSRIRVLRRVATRPMTITEIAASATIDAPAASVAVSDLESGGYVVREPSPRDRRSKQVRITDAGRALLARAWSVPDPAPQVLRSASAEDLRVLRDVLLGGDR